MLNSKSQKPLERDIENKVVRYAESRGIIHLKLALMFRRGWPDHIFWIPKGRPLLIEFKRKGEEPTRLQMLTLKRLEKLGYDVGWTDDKEEAITWIDEAISSALSGKCNSARVVRLNPVKAKL